MSKRDDDSSFSFFDAVFGLIDTLVQIELLHLFGGIVVTVGLGMFAVISAPQDMKVACEKVAAAPTDFSVDTVEKCNSWRTATSPSAKHAEDVRKIEHKVDEVFNILSSNHR